MKKKVIIISCFISLGYPSFKRGELKGVAFTSSLIAAGTDATDMDFEGDSLSGSRRLPLSSLINRAQVNTDNSSFVDAPKNWHVRMLLSTKSLESVRNKQKKEVETLNKQKLAD